MKPAHWPAHLQFSDSCRYHSSVSDGTRSFVQGASRPASNIRPGARASLVVIRPISVPSHPAFGQFGLFAAKRIPPNTHVIDYIGEIHCDERADSDYDLSLHRFQDGLSVGIDASVMGNEARFINDYRGVKDKPNAVFLDARTAGELRIGIWSARNGAIRKGEEILVSYGKAWWQARSTIPKGAEDLPDCN